MTIGKKSISLARNKGSCHRSEMVGSDVRDLHLLRGGDFQVFWVWRCWSEAAAAPAGLWMDGWMWADGAEQQLRSSALPAGQSRLSPASGDETNAVRQGHSTEGAAGLSEIVNSHLALINEIRLN